MMLKLPEKSAKADFIFVYLAYTLRYVYLLVLIPFYGRILGVEGYAVVLSAMSLMSMIWIFVNGSFSAIGLRSISKASADQFKDIFCEHFSARFIMAIFALVLGSVAISLSPVLSKNVLAAYFGIGLGIASAFNIGWYFTGTHRPRQAVMVEVYGFAISLSLILLFVKSKDDSDIVLCSLFTSGFFCLSLALWWIRKEVSLFKVDLRAGYLLIKESGALYVYQGITALVTASSTYLLGLLSSQSEVGYFGAADRLVSVGISLMGPAGSIFLPRITKLFAEDTDAAYDMVRKAFYLIVGIGISGCFASIVFGDLIIRLVFGSGFSMSAEILTIYSFTFPISALMSIIGSYLLFPQHQEKIMIKVGFISIIVYLLLLVPLSYFYGGKGMALARISSDIFSVCSLLYACRHLKYFQKLFLNYPTNQ